MNPKIPGLFLSAVVAIGLCIFSSSHAALAEGPDANSPGALYADRALINGRIITVDASDSIAEAVAIRDGRIVAVGTNQEIDALIGPQTDRIDLRGLTATPGLLDAHAHFAYGGVLNLTQMKLGFPHVKSIEDVVALVAARGNATRAGDWILGAGWDEGALSERRYIYAADLDPVSNGHPAWLMHTMGHYGVANSAALAIAGITRDTADPPGGVIDRHEDGKPTGVLKESAMSLVLSHVPAVTPEQLRQGIRDLAREFNREGMTGLKDPGINSDMMATLDVWNAYQDVLAEGALTVRVFALWNSPITLVEAEAFADRIAPFTKPYISTGDDRLISGGIKLFADGSGGARTAWMWEDWNKNRTGVDEGNRGFPAIDADVLRELIMLYHSAGIHMGVHAVGDRAIDWVVNSFELALHNQPRHGLRHSIIHSNIPTDHALDTMAQLQREHDAAYPEPTGAFTWWIGDTYAGNFGPERSMRLNPFRTYLGRGIRWAGGSDFFVTPFPARYGIWSSMARQPLLGVHGNQPFGRDEAVDARAALRSFTIWAARQMFMEDKIGSIEVGKYADIAVWNADLYSAPPDAIKDLKCQMTLFQGEMVYQK